MRYVDVPGMPRISRIGLGTWQFGSPEWGYGPEYDKHEAGAILQRALDLGVTLIDTAEAYGFGRSERIIGAALTERRDEAFLATKILPALPLSPIVEHRGIASARRLGVRHIDLYQVHRTNHLASDTTTMRGMAALRDDGLIGEVGVSNYPLDRWQRAETALGRRVMSNQVRYNLVNRDAERQLVPWAKATGRLVIAASPLAQGLLTGRYDAGHRPKGTVRATNPLFLAENLRHAAPLIATLREIAAAYDATPAQVALAWILRHDNVVAIPGAATIEQLETNVEAAYLVLADDEIAALSRAGDAFNPSPLRPRCTDT